MRCQLVYSVVIFSHRFLDSDCINCKLLHSWLFIDLSEHHYTALTSKFNNFFNRSSTMLNNVFNLHLTLTPMLTYLNSCKISGTFDLTSLLMFSLISWSVAVSFWAMVVLSWSVTGSSTLCISGFCKTEKNRNKVNTFEYFT